MQIFKMLMLYMRTLFCNEVHPVLYVESFSTYGEGQRYLAMLRRTRGAFGEIGKFVPEVNHAASRYSSFVLCLEHRLAGCVCFAVNNHDRKADRRRSLDRIRAKYLLLLHAFPKISGIDFVHASCCQCFDHNGVIKASRDIWTRSVNVEVILFRWGWRWKRRHSGL